MEQLFGLGGIVKMKKRIKHNLVVWSVTLVVGFLSWYTNYQRTLNGFFTSANWIFVDGLMYTILGALIIGGIIANFMPTKY